MTTTHRPDSHTPKQDKKDSKDYHVSNTTTPNPISKGATTIPLMAVVGAICTWCVGLSVAAFNANGSVSGLTASVADIKESILEIKDNTKGLAELKVEVDYLAKQRGYKTVLASTTVTDLPVTDLQ